MKQSARLYGGAGRAVEQCGASRATMSAMTDYRTVNRASWDERAPAHAASPDYGVERFVREPDFLSDVVRFDQPAWASSAGCAAHTCSATSGLTRSRSGGSAHA